jgi:DNA repair protein RadD
VDNLRDYQREAVDKAVYNLRRPSKPFIIVAATGAGKSHIIAGICEELAETPVLVLQPSKEILEQNYQKLVLAAPLIQVGIYSASKGRKEIEHVTFATIGSIRKKPDEFKRFKVVILDECHLLNPKKDDGMLTKFFKDIGCEHVVGLTATPYRTDVLWTREKNGDLTSTASLKMINRISRTPFFKSIAYKIETKELQDRGYLAPVKYFLEPSDWSQLRINSTGADFEATSAEKWAWKRVTRICDAIQYADGHRKRSLTFCGTIEQAEQVKEELEDLGIITELVTGTTPLKEREQKIADFKAGTFKHMLNVGVFTTGFDVPVLDCIILGKPTMSLSLYYQMVGRGIRIDPDDPGKVLHVYDLSGVVERLGRVETIRVVTEKGGFRDEVWSEAGRCDNYPLYSFTVTPKEKKVGKQYGKR